MDKTIHVDLRIGQSMNIGGATVVLEEKSGQRARLRITAGPSVRLDLPERGNGARLAGQGVIGKGVGELAPTPAT